MKIGIGQFTPRLGDWEHNLEKISRITRSTSADLWVFPEMCLTGYMFKDREEIRKVIEKIKYSELVTRLAELSRKTKSTLIVGLPELIGKKIFNAVWVMNKKGLLAKNQKTHLFFKEKFLFSPGETGPTLFEVGKVKVGLGICYDYMFPEYWRSLALRGAQIFINPANFVFRYGFQLMRTRAIENGVFSVCVNRVGNERGQNFFGNSEVVGNRGDVLFVAGDDECVKVVLIDSDKADDKKWNEYNDLFGDRRCQFYM
jgi:predicted amidohydrolase